MISLALITVILSCLLANIFCSQSDVCLHPFKKQGVDIPEGTMNCPGALPTWSYDSGNDTCEYWVYGGCGGNLNRFETEKECKEQCILTNEDK